MSFEKKIERAKRGNGRAFQELIEEEKNKLFRMAYLYTKNEDDALDIVQETVYKSFVSIKQLKDPHYFSTWISRILINTALDFIKKNKHTIPLRDFDISQKSHSIEVEEKLDLLDAIKQLDVPYKSVILLRYYKDLSVKQIAEIMQCPEGTVKTRLHRAINQLKINLNERCI
ncbi:MULTISPECIES: sigma-70 family RNA polymerase sigma factor [Cytobacillus]|uniref:RNA polymerase subunit sigma-70 n=1 Tax=Cytobacillus kochii TaxID=859143 RepID=A0A248TQ07_9BACI|nr:sigma-70 family RNA polymerase sigma factor [Cytobacillus kochii]ASV70245.1 RNA polymerase subunit sigma-70 [Cytobacillus kochii]MDQ0186728.1 RNA polymerase sigma-70 factor (ECF subfamily) [Cytobacillus kochii]